MKSLFISRVQIKNFRNFKDTDINLGHKQVMIGENNSGKSNFIRALQLIFDPQLTDEDRLLSEEDFFSGLEDPVENKEEIVINLFIDNYQSNKYILSQLTDASIIDRDGKEKLMVTYRYYPETLSNGEVEYQYAIYKGGDEKNRFTYIDRKYLNIKVIHAIRDVESNLKSYKKSPLNNLTRNYKFDKNELKDIAKKIEESGYDVLALDELVDLTSGINQRFSSILGMSTGFDVSFKTMEIEPNKLISSLKLMMGNRNTTEVSLGVNNILFIALILQQIQDRTIPTLIKKERYTELKSLEGSELLSETYQENGRGNYVLMESIESLKYEALYSFFDDNSRQPNGVTILVIEEPEAHLHPAYQRLVYKDVILNSNNSVLLTTHSTHITSIAPVDSIIHLRKCSDFSTEVNSTANLDLTKEELRDISRYVDIKRGEIYMGKGVVLVEGIAEEYIIPKMAEVKGVQLDENGIVVCNINSTNFKPYIKLLQCLNIPYAVITDGDYYAVVEKDGKHEREYHVLEVEGDDGFLGNELLGKLLVDLGILLESEIPDDLGKQVDKFAELGFFVGMHTLEVDMMEVSEDSEQAQKVFLDVFNELTTGGAQQKVNFSSELLSGDFYKCLRKIEGNGIGKGRFAQVVSSYITEEHIPGYIEKALGYIIEQVRGG